MVKVKFRQILVIVKSKFTAPISGTPCVLHNGRSPLNDPVRDADDPVGLVGQGLIMRHNDESLVHFPAEFPD